MKNARSAIIFILIASAIMLIPMIMSSHKSKEVALSVAFYNVENLFDTIDDPGTNDKDFLPSSKKNWDSKKYQTKINNIGRVIAQLSSDNDAPDILGLCEVENRAVLEDLIKMPGLHHLKIIHHDSPDQRGIDVALLYNSDEVSPINNKNIPVNYESGRKSRDILYTVLQTQERDILHVLVNHWPSRFGGQSRSEPRRIFTANVVKQVVDSILRTDSMAQVIVMGDFNDEPQDQSISETLNAGDQKQNILFNPFLAFSKAEAGSYLYRGQWKMLDQILISKGLWDYSSLDYVPESGTIFDQPWLRNSEGKSEGYPFRTFEGNKYRGGYSDHLPVHIDLYRNKH